MTQALNDPGEITFRRLASSADYEACVELQKATWGPESETVPLSILKITQKAGGVSAGAFAADGRLLGFVYGITGVRDGEIIHWSHMLGVAPEARDLGLGTRLKLYQRELLLPLGVQRVEWTYEPLEARNAHLNLNRLGAEVAEYVREMYEGEMGSELARGIGTDRFIVAWKIGGDRVARRLAEGPPDMGELARRYGGAPLLGPETVETGVLPPLSRPGRGGRGVRERDQDPPLVRVEIPENLQALKAEDLDRAVAFRASTRRAFESYLGRGYQVEAFCREPETGRCFYCLMPPHPE